MRKSLLIYSLFKSFDELYCNSYSNCVMTTIDMNLSLTIDNIKIIDRKYFIIAIVFEILSSHAISEKTKVFS